ncbi:MAG TPA: septum formation protein Maf, partial [Polyangiaceae bacterium]|nr:septum formation protein Maf [Polyangiaceae bacterium]
MRRVLASASPRRRQILETLGIPFDVVPSAADEAPIAGLTPAALAERWAMDKAQEVAGREAGLVLGADTIVVVDKRVLGKPRDNNDAADMLRRLSDRWHEVITGVALASEGSLHAFSVATRVRFRALSEARIERYVATGEGRDKAGAYAVQGIGAGLVTR